MFVIHDKKKNINISEDFSQLPCEQSRFDLIRNLFAFDLTALSRVLKADYAFVFRQEQKYVGHGDEKFTRLSGSIENE